MHSSRQSNVHIKGHFTYYTPPSTPPLLTHSSVPQNLSCHPMLCIQENSVQSEGHKYKVGGPGQLVKDSSGVWAPWLTGGCLPSYRTF